MRDDRIRVSPVGLVKSTVQKIVSNPSQMEKVLDLFGDYVGDGKNVLSTEDGPVVDVFRNTGHRITKRFQAGQPVWRESVVKASTGLWVWASYINHSCIPNAERECIGDLMFIRATRPIAAGEEIFQAYDASSDYDARQAALRTTWNFECRCALCAAEIADDLVVRRKREELAVEANALVSREHWSTANQARHQQSQTTCEGH